MNSRLIKRGTKRALDIQHFLFKEDFKECTPSIELGMLPDISENPAAAPDPVVDEESTVVSAVDTERLENEAFQKGFQQGETAGREAAAKEMESTTHAYAESIQEIRRLKPSLYSQAEREIVRLALEVAKKIVNREIQADRSIIQTLVRVALSRVSEKTSVTVRLNPMDYKFLMDRNDEMADEGCAVSLQSDNSIAQGGCLVETSCGDIDARIEEKFREVENAFFEDLK